MKLVALGDSITLGYGDKIPGGGWRGWASLLANVAGSQLSRAVARQPDVATVVVGVNDTLRDTFDAARIFLASIKSSAGCATVARPS